METDPVQGYQDARDALDRAMIEGRITSIVNARISIGRCYWLTQNYRDAATWYKTALAVSQAAHRKDLEARCFYWISTCYMPGVLPSDSSGGELYYKQKAIELLPWVDDVNFKINVLTEIGGHYYNQHDYGMANKCWKQAIDESHKPGVPDWLKVLAVNNLAGGFLAIGSTDSAGKYLFDLLRQIPECRDSGDKASALNTTLADYYIAKGQISLAIAATRRAIVTERRNSNNADFISVQYAIIARLFARQKNYDSAFRYMDYALVVKNNATLAAARATTSKDIIKAGFKSEVARYKADIETARTAKTASNKKLAISLLVLGIVAALAAILYRSDARNRQKNAMIQEQTKLMAGQKSLIEQSLAEKEVLLREIHHRVKNNLQQINGLLSLQLSSILDPVVQQALTASSARVGTIALIHQQLYQNEDPVAIDMQVFCSQLFDHISQLYDHPEPVRFMNQTTDVYLNADTAVPLSLILNELFTNSFKYAFEQEAKPAIFLSVQQEGPLRHRLTYHDNGPGLPPDTDYAAGTTLGMRLMMSLTRQLWGDFKYDFDKKQFIISFIRTDVSDSIH